VDRAVTDSISPVAPAEGRVIALIGIVKAVKGALLLGAAAGTFSLLGKDLDTVVDRLVEWAHLGPDSELVDWLYVQANALTDGKLKAIASVGVTYGLLLCTEGYGLLMRRKWAEQLVVVATLIPVPYEIYELVHRASLEKALVLAVNVAIVIYLLKRRNAFTTRAQRKSARAEEGSQEIAT